VAAYAAIVLSKLQLLASYTAGVMELIKIGHSRSVVAINFLSHFIILTVPKNQIINFSPNAFYELIYRNRY